MTYTVAIRSLAAPLTATVYMTDALPSGLAYVSDTLTATCGTVSVAAPNTPRWSGILSPIGAVTVTYAVTVMAQMPQTITNTAVIAAPDYQTITRTASIRANWRSVYLPLVLRN